MRKWFLKKAIKKMLLFLLPTSFVSILISVVVLFSVVTFLGIAGENTSEEGDGISISELGERDIPKQYIAIYKEAGKRYNIAWTLIAAFHKVETNFGTSPTMESSAGAIGHFQFLPETWVGWGYGANPPKSIYENPAMIAKYGGYGIDADGDGKADPYNIKDAAFTCANYVNASGGMAKLHDAIFSYNHAEWYVDKIMDYYKKYSKGDYNAVNGGGTPTSKGYILPVDNPNISSGFSDRTNPVTGQHESHKGLDFAQPIGSNIKAVKAGTVVIAQFDGVPVSGYGKCTIIDHKDGTWTLYAHQSEQLVRVGQSVKQGQIIGKVGSTGQSTGPHLHFEVRQAMLGGQVDPAKVLGIK